MHSPLFLAQCIEVLSSTGWNKLGRGMFLITGMVGGVFRSFFELLVHATVVPRRCWFFFVVEGKAIFESLAAKVGSLTTLGS